MKGFWLGWLLITTVLLVKNFEENFLWSLVSCVEIMIFAYLYVKESR